MSIIDKVVAAVAPPESERTRMKARAKARASAGKGDWLAMVLDHHEQVEAAFAAVKAYTEQAAAKLQLGLLEDLPPMSQEFKDRLEHIEGAVAHHVYEEESNWFLDLKSKVQIRSSSRSAIRSNSRAIWEMSLIFESC